MSSLTLRMDLLNVLKITDSTLENIYADCFLTTSQKSYKRNFTFLKIENFTRVRNLDLDHENNWNGATRLYVSQLHTDLSTNN